MAMDVDNESLDELTMAELVLDELGSRLPSPTEANSIQGVAGSLLGARARDLHRGFVHALDGPSMIAPTILTRPLVELAILIRWIQDNARLRFEMWTAHSEEMDARAIRQLSVNLPRPADDPFGPAAVHPVLEAKDARATAARTAAGRETPPRLLPGLVEMVDAIVKSHPDEGLALRQAYDLAFRSISPATHSDASSFRASLDERPRRESRVRRHLAGPYRTPSSHCGRLRRVCDRVRCEAVRGGRDRGRRAGDPVAPRCPTLGLEDPSPRSVRRLGSGAAF